MTKGIDGWKRAATMAALLWSDAGLAQSVTQGAECDCRARGLMWSQGSETCIQGELHVCGMNQNVSAWISTRKSCPTAFLGRRVSQSYADSAFFSSARSE